MDLPSDPAILQSYINTLLRDRYPSFEQLADDLDIPMDSLLERLKAAGLEYEPSLNKVW